MIKRVSVGVRLTISLFTNLPSIAKAVACFIPIEIAIATAINQMASKVYFAIFHIDFIFGDNNLNPNTVRKKNGIPTAKNINNPNVQTG